MKRFIFHKHEASYNIILLVKNKLYLQERKNLFFNKHEASYNIILINKNNIILTRIKSSIFTNDNYRL